MENREIVDRTEIFLILTAIKAQKYTLNSRIKLIPINIL